MTDSDPAPSCESGPLRPPCFMSANLITSFMSNFQLRLSFIICSSSSGSRCLWPQKVDSPYETLINIIFYKFGSGLDCDWVSRPLKLSFAWLAQHKDPFEVLHVIFIWVDAPPLFILPGEGKYFIVFGCRVGHSDTRRGEVVRVSPWNSGLRTNEQGPVLMCESVPEKYLWVSGIHRRLLSCCGLWGRLFFWKIKSAWRWVTSEWGAVFPDSFFQMTHNARDFNSSTDI